MLVANTVNKSIFQSRAPFPNIVFDEVFPDSYISELYAEVESLKNDGKWFVYDNPLEVKNAREDLPPKLRTLAEFFNSEPFVASLSELVGVKLLPNPDLRGAGLHRISSGGKLDLHLDHNRYNGKERKLNLIFWFHDVQWREEWNGHLELWSEQNGQPSECIQRITPKRNRMALFECSEKSIHGHPHPLKCPADVFRTSLALYYYTDEVSDSKPRKRVRFLRHPAAPADPTLDNFRKAREEGSTDYTS